MAAASGVGFGLFQSVNVRALRPSDDPWASTFVQVTLSAVVLTIAALAVGDMQRIADAPVWAIGDFALAGVLHFLVGWSLVNMSQQRVGAARTSPLLTTAPLFGVVIAMVTLGQFPGAIGALAIALISAGAYLVTARGGIEGMRPIDAVPGLGCAFCWALSPVFTLHGLEGFDSPLVGVAVGLIACVVLLAPYVAFRGLDAWSSMLSSAPNWKVLAGFLVAGATWARWAALEDVSVGGVLALTLLSVPIVLFLAPILAGRHLERVTLPVWAGAALVVAGSLVLISE
jgi:drug/metabolite transporter (DMT)-like permease